MKPNFSADFFIGNRARLRELFIGTAPIVITANGKLQQAATEGFPFHQDRHFWYLTGINEPDIVLVMDKTKEYLILPERTHTQEVFDGTTDIEKLAATSGVAEILSFKEGWKRLGGRLKRAKHAATLAAAPTYIDVFGIYANPARAELIKRIKDLNADIDCLDLRTHIARMRMVKQPCELQAIQTAIDITVSSIKAATKPAKIEKYTHEYQLEAELTKGFRSRGATGHAFTPIVASGHNACTLHYVDNNDVFQRDQFTVIDVGADYGRYAADISRTIMVDAPTKRQVQVYEAVLDVHRYACSLLKPGVVPVDYEADIEAYMGEKLRELGLIRTIEHDEVRRYFPHATSHFLGLDTHDAGDYKHPHEPGVVVTVEPGIYIPEEGIGVRIEDDILITQDGMEILSDALPRALS